MKIAFNIFLLISFFVVAPAVSLYILSGSRRHVVVRVHHKDGAVLLNGKKVRVPYRMQETAIPTQSDGLIEYLFLNDYELSMATSVSLLLMGILFVFIYYINMTASGLSQYRAVALKTLLLVFIAFVISEFASFQTTNGWIIDTKHGINGNPGFFGVNATFPNGYAESTLELQYHAQASRFIMPLIALWVLSVNRKRTRPEVEL